MRASIPVLSVGNITVGGSGKTPLICLIANELQGRKLAIFYRGYGAKKKGPYLIQKEDKALDIGDEPALVARRFPSSLVYVGKKRARLAALAEQAGAERILLDDGFQHRALARDADIVVVSCRHPLDAMLPVGPLREPLSSLARASIVVLSHCQNPEDYDRRKEEISKYTGAPIVAVRETITSIQGACFVLDPGELRGKTAVLFCGIGDPARFCGSIERLGVKVLESFHLPDHGTVTKKELEKYKSFGADLVLCTEKDFVKIEGDGISYAQLGLEIFRGAGEWKQFINSFR